MARVSCPVMLVHGHGDTTVPVAVALPLQRAARKAESIVVAGEHDLREARVPQPVIVEFLRRALAD